MAPRSGPKHFTNDHVLLGFLTGSRRGMTSLTEDQAWSLASLVHHACAFSEAIGVAVGMRKLSFDARRLRSNALMVPEKSGANATVGGFLREAAEDLARCRDVLAKSADRLIGHLERLGLTQREITALQGDRQLACAYVLLEASKIGTRNVTPLDMEALWQLAGMGSGRELADTSKSRSVTARREAWKTSLAKARRVVLPILRRMEATSRKE